MPVSITVVNPMPGYVLQPSFTASGNFLNSLFLELHRNKVEDWNARLRLRTALTISVTVTKASSSYGPFPATISGSAWSSNVSEIPAGTGYTLTATITDGTDMASHSIETIDIQDTPPPIVIMTITPPPQPYAAAVQYHDLEGTYDPTVVDADTVYAVVYNPGVTMTDEAIPNSRGHHHKVRYNLGNPDGNPFVYGTLDRVHKTWKVLHVPVNEGQFVQVYVLKSSTGKHRSNSSRLF